MLKIIVYRALIIFIPRKSNWSVVSLAIFVGTFLSLIFIIDKFSFNNIAYVFNLDTLSYALVVLSIWLRSLMIIARTSVNRFNFKPSLFILLVLLLISLLVITFSVSNMFLFYLYFEATLIPTLILIMGWGYQPERIQAGIYILFYTLTASLPLLLLIIWVKTSYGSLSFILL